MKNARLWIAAAALSLSALPMASTVAAPKKPAAKKAPAKKPAANAGQQALKLSLPVPAYQGTPKNLPPGLNVEKPTGKARPTFYVPRGTALLSKGKPVTSSDTAPVIGELSLITDGEKSAGDGYFVELGPFKQWVQIDLGRAATMSAIALWHDHSAPSVYRDVVVQASDDADFVTGVKTIYDNTRAGKDKLYFESNEGRLINAKGAKARYVRFYSNGSTGGDENRYTEIEIYGK